MLVCYIEKQVAIPLVVIQVPYGCDWRCRGMIRVGSGMGEGEPGFNHWIRSVGITIHDSQGVVGLSLLG